jgi:hypothetical protein
LEQLKKEFERVIKEKFDNCKYIDYLTTCLILLDEYNQDIYLTKNDIKEVINKKIDELYFY